MLESIRIKNAKMYCFKCDEMTETTDKRKEIWKEWHILRGTCKMCDTDTIEKVGLIKKPDEIKMLI